MLLIMKVQYGQMSQFVVEVAIPCLDIMCINSYNCVCAVSFCALALKIPIHLSYGPGHYFLPSLGLIWVKNKTDPFSANYFDAFFHSPSKTPKPVFN